MQFRWRKEINALQEDIVKGVLKGSLSILTERVDVAVEEFQRWRQLSHLFPRTFGTSVSCEQDSKQFQMAVRLL
jgi:hypothetical protein